VLWAPFTFTIVNLVCLVLLLRLTRREGVRLTDMLGFRRERLLRDLGLGLLLSFGLGLLFVCGVLLGGLVLYGTDLFARFETVFVGDADFSLVPPAWLALVTGLVFPVVNASVEELHYRGYVQPRLVAAWGVWTGIAVTILGFALQHIAFAATIAGAFVYVVAYLFWGAGAGVFAHRNRRLAPLVLAHLVTNLSFAIIPLVVLFAS
jgi:membrane protease YdiL (CAAX protease family)